MRLNIGRYIFGVSVIVLGVVTMIWHTYGPVLSYLAAAAEILGGTAIQFRRTARLGAFVLMAVFLVFGAVRVPAIISGPLVYNNWGNFFEMISLFTGAAIVYGHFTSKVTPETVSRIGRVLFGICSISFMLEQAFYLNDTAVFVPKWLAPSPMFWAMATTIFFALGAIALLINRMTLLAARLLTAMIVGFGLIVWVPLVVAGPKSHGNWSEIALNFAIAGAAWILADVLADAKSLPDAGARESR